MFDDWGDAIMHVQVAKGEALVWLIKWLFRAFVTGCFFLGFYVLCTGHTPELDLSKCHCTCTSSTK